MSSPDRPTPKVGRPSPKTDRHPSPPISRPELMSGVKVAQSRDFCPLRIVSGLRNTPSGILAWRIPQQRSLVGYSPWGHTELDTTERLSPTEEYSHVGVSGTKGQCQGFVYDCVCAFA